MPYEGVLLGFFLLFSCEFSGDTDPSLGGYKGKTLVDCFFLFRYIFPDDFCNICKILQVFHCMVMFKQMFMVTGIQIHLSESSEG